MSKRIFVAGASGAIGKRLMQLLIKDGWVVQGMTRHVDRAQQMQALGISTVVADAFDSNSLHAVVSSFEPDVVMHQMTDLPRELAKLDEAALERNAAVRKLGTRHLLDAAIACRAKRFVAQSIAFDYAVGPLPHIETDPLAGRLTAPSVSSQGVTSLEDQVMQSGIPFVILRYGRLYGPGTGSKFPWGPAAVHVDAAAHAARLAAESLETGIFNIAEEDGEVDSTNARSKLGWSPNWRVTQ